MLRHRWIGRGLAIAAVCAAVGAGAPAAMADVGGLGDEHFDLPGAPYLTAANVGDVNGDGHDDIAVEESGLGGGPGETWVLYGRTATDLDVSTPAFAGHGFTISGTGFSTGIVGVGDVNGDGLGAIALRNANSVDVVFGQRGDQPVNLSNLGDSGFTITNVLDSGAMGFGYTGYGTLWENTTMTALSDPNAPSGRALALVDGADATVVELPRDAGGTQIDESTLATDGYVLEPSGSQRVAFVGDLGDLYGDGHDWLAVAADDPTSGTVSVYGVEPQAPGTVQSLDAAVAAGQAFEFTTTLPALSSIENMITLGNAFGDGRRAIGVALAGPQGRQVYVLRTPAPGTVGSITDPSNGFWFAPWHSNVIDLGDQSGDGIDDYGLDGAVFDTTGAPPPAGTQAMPAFWVGESPGNPMMAAAVPDPVPGYPPDVVTVQGRDDPTAGPTEVDVYYSTDAPSFLTALPPVVVPSTSVTFAATFKVLTGALTAALQGSLTINGGIYPNDIPAGSTDFIRAPGLITETFTVPATELPAGGTYSIALTVSGRMARSPLATYPSPDIPVGSTGATGLLGPVSIAPSQPAVRPPAGQTKATVTNTATASPKIVRLSSTKASPRRSARRAAKRKPATGSRRCRSSRRPARGRRSSACGSRRAY